MPKPKGNTPATAKPKAAKPVATKPATFPEPVIEDNSVAPEASPLPERKPDALAMFLHFLTADEIEGGYVNHPNDPGGETKYGISKRSYPKLDIENLTMEDARDIYGRDYFDVVRGDDVPPALAICLADTAVNQGPVIAIRLMQSVLRVKVDGQFGPITMAAVEGADLGYLIHRFLSKRMRRYSGTANAVTFIEGWAGRMFYLRAYLHAHFPSLSPDFITNIEGD